MIDLKVNHFQAKKNQTYLLVPAFQMIEFAAFVKKKIAYLWDLDFCLDKTDILQTT